MRNFSLLTEKEARRLNFSHVTRGAPENPDPDDSWIAAGAGAWTDSLRPRRVQVSTQPRESNANPAMTSGRQPTDAIDAIDARRQLPP